MSISVNRNTITVNGPEFDIYDAIELKETLDKFVAKGKKSLNLNLFAVERISTPAIQVVLSAKETFSKCEIDTGDMKESVIDDLCLLGVEI